MRAFRVAWHFAMLAGALSVLAVACAPAARADIPGQGIVTAPAGAVGDLLGGAAGWGFDQVAKGIAKWVLGAVSFFVGGAVHFLQSSSRPQVDADWFAGPGSPFAAVRNIAAVLLLAFALLAVLQGLFHGDVSMMLRQVAGKVPAAIAGMVVTTAVAVKLLDLTDALSGAVLATTNQQAIHFLSGFGVTVTNVTAGFAPVVLGLVAVVAALILWVELLVRSSLVYLLVAISPLGFAAMVWPSARGFLRKTIELLIAVIVSKFVICVALAIGVAALSGAGEAAGTDSASAGLGNLLVGAVLLGLAAFSPFIVLKLVPAVEAAAVGHGVSRGPLRAAQSGALGYSTVSRLAGGSSASRQTVSAPPAPATSGATGPSGAGGSAAGGSAGLAAGAATAGIALSSIPARRAGASAERTAERSRDGGASAPPRPAPRPGQGQEK